MVMINFDCNNLIICLYPRGSGGNFLVNCLSLSNDVIITDIRTYELQLQNKLDPEKKFLLLQNQIKKTSDKKWNDFNLDDVSIWNSQPEDIDYLKLDEYILKLNKSESLRELTHDKKCFSILPHYQSTYFKLKHLWKNSKSIIFDNSLLFILIRNCERDFSTYLWLRLQEKYPEQMEILCPTLEDWKYLPNNILKDLKNMNIQKIKLDHEQLSFNSIWKKVREDHWPKDYPKTIKEFINYDENLKSSIISSFNNLSGYYFNDLEDYPKKMLKTCDHVWDTNWFFCKEQVLKNIKEIYSKFNISNYNQQYISNLYDYWIEKNESITLFSREKI
jgi:hypothetical protein